MSETEVTTEKYEFGPEFEELILGYLYRDQSFSVRTDGLVKPQYFESEVNAALAALAVDYFAKYKVIPSKAAIGVMLKDAFAKKQIRADLKDEVKEQLLKVMDPEFKLTALDFAVEQVAKFARRQELTKAILSSVDLIEKGDFDAIEKLITKANMTGVNDGANGYDFFAERENRLDFRKEVAAGTIKPTGITTGHAELDNILYHKGWGRKELSVIMGAAKAGKSMALVSFGVKAMMAGYKVLYVSLEVATKIIADRMDANLSAVAINSLTDQMKKASDAVELAESLSKGVMKVHDFPSGTFTPNQLRRLLHRYKAQGLSFDLVIVDYADLMAPDRVSNEPRENSRLIYVGLRGIASEFDTALLSATQTNRAGFKEVTAKMENVADDINKVRTVDLLLSINADDDEKAANEARVFFAASRNQQGGQTVYIKTNMAAARFIETVVKIN